MGFTERDIQILRQADVIEFRDDGTTHEIVATLRDRVRDDESSQDYEHRIAVYGFVTVFWYPGRDTDDVRS